MNGTHQPQTIKEAALNLWPMGIILSALVGILISFAVAFAR